jgi:hypothetical protein
MSLGTLFVDLKANTASFVGDLGKASVVARNAAKDISREFQTLGRVASQTFGPFASFNPIVSQLSFALSGMGRAAAGAMGSFGKVSSGLGALASLGAGAVAGIGSAEVAVVALALHAAESAAKLNQLSQATGVSVEALSGFGFVAKQMGVESQVMVLGLERMSRSAFAAATAPAGTINAYTRLGISVRDSSGQIRSTQVIFEELAQRFSAMPDGVTKTALAIQLFGRGGAQMIPILNEGSAGVQKLLETAQRLGVVISSETGAAAQRFEQTLGELSAAGQGASISLMRDLLPALQTIATSFTQTNAEGQSALSQIASWTAKFVEGTMGVLNTWFHAFEQVGSVVELVAASIVGSIEAVIAAAKASGKLAMFDFSGAEASAIEGLNDLKKPFDKFWDETKKTWADNTKFINGVFDIATPFTGNVKAAPGSWPGADILARTRPRGGFEPDESAEKKKAKGGLGEEPDTVVEMVAKLAAEAQAQSLLASATDRATAAMTLQKAAAESFQKVADQRVELEKKLAGLNDEKTKAKGTPEAAEIQKRIDRIKDLLNELILDTPQIQALYAQIGAGKFAETAEDEAHKFIQSTEEQTASIRRMAAAYAESPLAVGKAEAAVKIAPLELNLGVLGQLKEAGAITAAEYDVLATQIQKAISAVHDLTAAEVNEAVAKQGQGIATQIAGLNRLTAAAFASAAALRGVEVENKVQEFRVTNKLDVNDPQLGKVRAQFEAEANAEHSSQLATRAAQLDVSVGYAREIEQLEQIKEIYGDNKNVMLAAAAAELEAQQRSTEQWDAQARAAGSFGDRVTAIFDKVQMDGQKFGEHVFDAFSHAIDDVSTQLAKMAVTGKSNFKQLFDSLAEELLKAQIQRGFAAIFTGVAPASASPKPLGNTMGNTSAPGGILQSLGGIFGINAKPQPPRAMDEAVPGAPGATNVATSGPSGGLFGLFAHLFQPHAATPPPPALAGGFPFDLSHFPLTGEGEVPRSGSAASGGLRGELGGIFGIASKSKAAAGPSGPTGAAGSPFHVILDGGAGGPLAGFGGAPAGAGAEAPGSLFDQLKLPLTGEGVSSGGSFSAGGMLENLARSAPGGGGSNSSVSGDISAALKASSGILSSIKGIGGLLANKGASGGIDANGGLADLSKFPLTGEGSGGNDTASAFDLLAQQAPSGQGGSSSGGSAATTALTAIGAGASTVSLFASIMKIFSGFRAGGGDVSPGKAYVVGEKHPEWFVPDQAGSIMPSLRTGNNPQGGTHTTVVQMNINGVQDVDSFNRSKGQILSGFHQQASIAYARHSK